MTESAAVALLIVDDDPLLTDLFRQYMSRQGYAVQVADTAEAAAEFLESGDVDLIVTDLVLPGESGLDLATRVYRSRPDTGVIIVTGHDALPQDAEMPANVADVLHKPFRMQELEMRIRSVLARQHALTEARRAAS